MNNNAWFRKEKPLLSLQSMSGGAAGSLMQGAATKTYVDDVFSTYIYEGTQTAKTITNGIDLAGEGGMVWIKNRVGTWGNNIFDTVRGAGKIIRANSSNAYAQASFTLNAFNSDGFGLGNDSMTNANGGTTVSYSFRKAPGFFDVVQYTGTGSTQTLSHSLKSIPGCIMVKRTDTTADWGVYHRGQNGGVDPEDYRLRLNSSTTENNDTYWGDTAPTATQFTVGDAHTEVNASGGTYIAYIFAGGASTASTATSVDFDGSGDYLEVDYTTEYQFSSNDFTIEFWARVDTYAAPPDIIDTGDAADSNRWRIFVNASGNIVYRANKSNRITSTNAIVQKSWHHYAIARSSGTTTLYIDGRSEGSFSDSIVYGPVGSFIGRKYDGSNQMDGAVSNYRLVNGTAVYTTDFIPPTQPLTNITNTKLLCCQGSSATDATVIPSGDSITANGDAAVSTNSPFDDPDAFKFGPDEDKPIIKCGSYIGNGSTAGPEIILGWEPSWVLIKDTSASVNWRLHDSMRGIVTGGDDPEIEPNTTDAESDSNRLDLTSTGFKLTTNSASHNDPGDSYIYMAIRRPDGYVGKPAEAGTDVFTTATGNGSGVEPAFTSGFPIDFAFGRQPASAEDMYTWGRLMQGKYLKTNSTASQLNDGAAVFDWNTGFNLNYPSSYQSWMWKRGQGFDVVTYTGDDVAGRGIPHSLATTPEMIWIKYRNDTTQWVIGHKGRNGGVNPWNYFSALNGTGADEDNTLFNDTSPTSTHFTVGSDNDVNNGGGKFIAMLFASVSGISKVGSYTGTGSSHDISLDFTPRFLIIKRTDGTGNWVVYDTTRGWSSSSNKVLLLNATDAQYTFTGTDIYAEPGLSNGDSKGFRPVNAHGDSNTNTSKYIYYAHA